MTKKKDVREAARPLGWTCSRLWRCPSKLLARRFCCGIKRQLLESINAVSKGFRRRRQCRHPTLHRLSTGRLAGRSQYDKSQYDKKPIGWHRSLLTATGYPWAS